MEAWIQCLPLCILLPNSLLRSKKSFRTFDKGVMCDKLSLIPVMIWWVLDNSSLAELTRTAKLQIWSNDEFFPN